MDAIREFFYWTASIALILISLLVIGTIAFIIYLKRLANRAVQKLDLHLNTAQDTLRKYTWTRMVIKALRLIF